MAGVPGVGLGTPLKPQFEGYLDSTTGKELVMKAYGHSRRDKLACRYGCCTTKSGKAKNCRVVVDRANRKTARQEAALVYLLRALDD